MMFQRGQVRPNAPAAPGAQVAPPLTFHGQGPGEVVRFILRPHWLWYLVSSWRIVMLLLVMIGLIFVAGVLSLWGVPTLIFWGIVVALAVWHIVRWIAEDLNTWLFRRYILTDWRVIDDLGIVAQDRRVASLQRIQDVRVTRSTPFAMLFDIGDVEIMTAGAKGDLKLEGVHHPQHVAQLIRIEQLNHGDKWFAKAVPIQVPALQTLWQDIDEADDPPPPALTPLPSAHRHVPINFLPNEVVLECIRRHWINFIWRAKGGILVILIGVILSYVYDAGGPTLYEPLHWMLFGGSITIGLLWVLGVWLNYADDYLILTTSRVIKLERRFYFFADTTDEMSYRKIQDVDVQVDPIGITFGYGKIIIEAAGKAKPITMNFMPHPQRLEDRIYFLMDFAEARSERTKRKIRRMEVGRWMGMMLNTMFIIVPDVRNLNVAQAARRTRAEGLRLVVGGERPVVGMPPGLVIDQSPHPGSTAMRENEIRVLLSGSP